MFSFRFTSFNSTGTPFIVLHVLFINWRQHPLPANIVICFITILDFSGLEPNINYLWDMYSIFSVTCTLTWIVCLYSLLVLYWLWCFFFSLLISKGSLNMLDVISTLEPEHVIFLKETEYKIYNNHIWFLHLVRH